MRETNQELCARFRKLLTDGASECFEIVAHQCERNAPEPPPLDNLLAITKPWRNELWRAFREIEDRMCPKPPER